MAAFVSLIGAGPGDPELITVRGQHALCAADVIVHDDLVDPRLLIPYSRRPVYRVADRRLSAEEREDRLFTLLSKLIAAGHRIAHLKGGDALLFARGIEEIQFLRAKHIQYEIIPGITAAVAAAAYAELPLTRRKKASSVAFCTGHVARKKEPKADTLVYYMTSTRLAHIAQQLQSEGWNPSTPVTLVRSASRPDQSVVFMTLEEATESVPLLSPGIVVIGQGAVPIEVNDVSLNSDTNQNTSWFSRAPKVLITGTSTAPYRHLGELVHTPLISIEEPETWEALDAAIAQIEGYDLIVFTSRYAVRAFINRLVKLGGDTRSLANSQLAAVGSRTSTTLRDCGLSADIVAQPETTAGLITAIRKEGSLVGKKVLLPRSQIADDILPAELEALGGETTKAIAYCTIPVINPLRIDLDVCDAVLFSSPSTVRMFQRLYGTSLPDDVSVWCRGPQTKAVAQKTFGRGEILP